MTTLENDQLKVSIRPKGAELTSIVHKPTNTEHLWQADPSVWGWHAPNLFPVVGGCLNNQLHIGGKGYPMERHGFARQSTFMQVESTASHAVFSLSSDSTTEAVYPYRFQFQIIYELNESTLQVTYRIQNEDEQTMYFSVGAHPAFRVPFNEEEAYEDYYIEFDKEEELKTHVLSSAGLFTGQTRPVELEAEDTRLPLTKHLFDQDALVFKSLQSRQVSLKSWRHSKAITLDFTAFPYLGIWAKPGASFVCIEPWLGCADSEDQAVPIQEKEAIQQVGAGQVFNASFSIRITEEILL
ncbi:aldose 1-epimerase family protein [Fibrisoma montanum]|uniref:Aldose 1-epimerase family protein n=1 Tax=Fibrisoma montanum TaxID=2305895 RepID=A0A418M7X2_9BACT|nr:aldose 1-epimerase family protein [Fibrisoma montanum]RIV22230.1 aldose 1-epimerase family protein [Fibrisoma montanum]